MSIVVVMRKQTIPEIIKKKNKRNKLISECLQTTVLPNQWRTKQITL